jgi:hypothetical protein
MREVASLICPSYPTCAEVLNCELLSKEASKMKSAQRTRLGYHQSDRQAEGKSEGPG